MSLQFRSTINIHTRDNLDCLTSHKQTHHVGSSLQNQMRDFAVLSHWIISCLLSLRAETDPAKLTDNNIKSRGQLRTQ